MISCGTGISLGLTVELRAGIIRVLSLQRTLLVGGGLDFGPVQLFWPNMHTNSVRRRPRQHRDSHIRGKHESEAFP